MARNPWKITPATLALLDDLDTERAALAATLNALHEALDSDVTELQSEFEDKSDSWKEGDRGTTVQDWLDAWDTFKNDVESVASGLDDIETPPNDTPEFN